MNLLTLATAQILCTSRAANRKENTTKMPKIHGSEALNKTVNPEDGTTETVPPSVTPGTAPVVMTTV